MSSDERKLKRTDAGERAWKTMTLPPDERRLLGLLREPTEEGVVKKQSIEAPLVVASLIRRGWVKIEEGIVASKDVPANSSSSDDGLTPLERLRRKMAQEKARQEEGNQERGGPDTAQSQEVLLGSPPPSLGAVLVSDASLPSSFGQNDPDAPPSRWGHQNSVLEKPVLSDETSPDLLDETNHHGASFSKLDQPDQDEPCDDHDLESSSFEAEPPASPVDDALPVDDADDEVIATPAGFLGDVLRDLAQEDPGAVHAPVEVQTQGWGAPESQEEGGGEKEEEDPPRPSVVVSQEEKEASLRAFMKSMGIT